jgi:hypothetical protein
MVTPHAGEAICGSPTPLDFAIHAKWGNHSRNLLVTTADMKIVVWRVEAENRKLYPSFCDTGKRKRCNQCVVCAEIINLNIPMTTHVI